MNNMNKQEKSLPHRMDVKRRGYGHGQGRSELLARLSLWFWTMIAHVAIKRGRVAVVTGSTKEAGANEIVGHLPGRLLTATNSLQLDVSEVKSPPRAGHVKILDADALGDQALCRLLVALASEDRSFSLSTSRPEMVRNALLAYSAIPGARPLFVLQLI